jgi:hypothetical protein
MKIDALTPFAARVRSGCSRPVVFNFLGAMLLLVSFGQTAQATVLLDENFNDNAADYLPNVFGEATAAAINIRLGNNQINTSGDSGFDSFFAATPNRFLVIGDNTGNIGGEPNGQPSFTLTEAVFDLGVLGAGQHRLVISFDYAFDTNQEPGTAGTSSDDYFSVELLAGAFQETVLSFDGVLQNDPSRKGHFNEVRDITLASASNVSLAFGLLENPGTGSSAAGIDNLKVAELPEPGSLALFSMGLIGLGFARRGKA